MEVERAGELGTLLSGWTFIPYHVKGLELDGLCWPSQRLSVMQRPVSTLGRFGRDDPTPSPSLVSFQLRWPFFLHHRAVCVSLGEQILLCAAVTFFFF
jgi:hypothetical protein